MVDNDVTFPSTLKIARLLGLTGVVISLILYGQLVLFNPYSHQGLNPQVYGVIILLSLLALVAGWASFKLKAELLLVTFLLSFFPVGLYLLGTPGLFRWIGISHLFYLVAGMSMMIYRRKQSL